MGWRKSASVLLATLTFAAPLSAQTEISARAASIRVGGRLHYQYAWSSHDDAAPADFFVRRARLTLDITVTDLLDARVMTDFAGGEAELEDVYVRFKPSDAFHISVGQFKRAGEIFELSSSTDLSIIERDARVSGVSGCGPVGGTCSFSRLTEKLAFSDRDAGIRIEGALGERVHYMATLTNGTGINAADENDGKSPAGRLTVSATDDVRISGFFGLHDHPSLENSAETDYAPAGGFDVEVGSWRDGIHLQMAVIQGENWRIGPEATFRAAQALLTWYHPFERGQLAGIEPVLRIGWADPDTGSDDDHALALTPGLMVYVSGKNRVGANLDVFHPATGDTAYSLKLQSFLYF